MLLREILLATIDKITEIISSTEPFTLCRHVAITFKSQMCLHSKHLPNR